MKFTTTTALLSALGLISSTTASPIQAATAAELEQHFEPIQDGVNGTTVVFEEQITTKMGITGVFQILLDESLPEAETSTDVTKRCGSNQVNCDYNSNRAITGICGLLMDHLGEDSRLSASQLTSLCFTATNIQNNNRCCVAWQRKVSGLVRGHLLAAATDSFRCSRDELVSAWVADVNLNGACMNQCLSNQDRC